jgi:hypothetical protein
MTAETLEAVIRKFKKAVIVRAGRRTDASN